MGVDLNRNYPDPSWCEEGASKSPCSDTYCGTAAAGQPETKASVDYFRRLAPVIGAIDWCACAGRALGVAR